MGPFRQTAALLLVAMLAPSIDHAEAAVLLPAMDTFLESSGQMESVSNQMTSHPALPISQSDETGDPLPCGLRIVLQSPMTSTTSPSVATGTVIGGAVLAAWPIKLIDGCLSSTVENHPRCGWNQLDRTRVFRPPRSAA